jgi:RNA polymerase sigma-70 factor, ECF subfamily
MTLRGHEMLQTTCQVTAVRATAETGMELLRSLIVSCAHGDQNAFARLHRLTKRKMFGVALRLLHRPDLAEEIVQEAYIRIWHRASYFDPALSSPITWMVTIVRNLAIDTVRRTRMEGCSIEEGVLLDMPSLEDSALDKIEASEKRGLALMALQGLDPVQRSLIVAAYVRGYSREQLAAKYRAPVSTIKTWIRRAIIQAAASVTTAS